MSDVYQHIYWVFHGHKEVIQLIKSHLITDNVTIKMWEQRSAPIEESASCRFSYIPLPVGDHIDLPCEKVELPLLSFTNDILKDKTFAVVNNSFS